MRFLYTSYLILGALLFFSSCSYKPSQVLFEKKRPIPDSVFAKRANTNISNYRIQPQDILQIRNLQNSKAIVDLTPTTSSSNTSGASVTTQPETFLVEDDGTVALTGLGRVPVAGLTRLEAMNKIESLYKDTVLLNPIIEIKIINLKVTLLGEVKAPNNYPLTKDRTTLVELIGAAGGLTEKADEKNIQIIRGDKKDPTVIKIDLSNLATVSDPRAVLQNDDIIIVGPNDKTVRAEQLQNFTTVIQPLLIVLSALIVITSLIKR